MLLRYLAKRLIYLVIVFIVISMLIFIVYRMVPGDPVMMHMNPEEARLPPAAFEVVYNEIRARLGLDRSLPVQYGIWLSNMVRGDFGLSLNHNMPVTTVLQGPVMVTLQLNIIAMILVIIICVPLGISSAVKRGGIYDNAIQTITLMGFSLPVFITAILFVMIFAVWLGLTPVSGFGNPLFAIQNPDATSWEIFLDRVPFMILPISVMVFTGLAGLTRLIRVSMIDALSQDYTRTARAKGLREGAVIFSHAFRNAQLPFVTSIAGSFIALLTGSIILEELFSVSGMGRLFIDSLRTLDFNVALAISTIFTVLTLVGYLLLDFVYVLIDPRVKLE